VCKSHDVTYEKKLEISGNICRLGLYRAFHRFGQAKFSDGGLVLGLSQFSILPQLHPKILLDSKVVQIDRKKSSRFVNLNP